MSDEQYWGRMAAMRNRAKRYARAILKDFPYKVEESDVKWMVAKAYEAGWKSRGQV